MELQSNNALKWLWLLAACLISIIALPACNHEEPQINEQELVAVGEIYPIIVTEMEPQSIIALPSGLSFAGSIMNSYDVLKTELPSEVIEKFPEFGSIDFENYSFISLTYRIFYEVSNIEYKIYKQDNQLVINQIIYVSGEISSSGYFMMSNLTVDKVPDNISVSLQQAFIF